MLKKQQKTRRYNKKYPAFNLLFAQPKNILRISFIVLIYDLY